MAPRLSLQCYMSQLLRVPGQVYYGLSYNVMYCRCHSGPSFGTGVAPIYRESIEADRKVIATEERKPELERLAGQLRRGPVCSLDSGADS